MLKGQAMKAAKCLFPLKSAMFRISKNFDEQRLEQNRPFLTILPYISFLEGAKKPLQVHYSAHLKLIMRVPFF